MKKQRHQPIRRAEGLELEKAKRNASLSKVIVLLANHDMLAQLHREPLLTQEIAGKNEESMIAVREDKWQSIANATHKAPVFQHIERIVNEAEGEE